MNGKVIGFPRQTSDLYSLFTAATFLTVKRE